MPASGKESLKRHQSIIVRRINILLAGRALDCNQNYGGGCSGAEKSYIQVEGMYFFCVKNMYTKDTNSAVPGPNHFSMLKSVGWASTDRIHQVVLGLPLEDPELKCNL